MSIYVRKKVRSPSGTLLITFLLGVAIGFSLGYAFYGGERETPPATPPAIEPDITAQPVSTEQPVSPPEETQPPETPPTEQAPPVETEQPVSVPPPQDEIWPGRYLFVALAGTSLDDATAALLKEIRPCGVVLRPENLVDEAQTRQLVAAIKSAAGMGTAISDLPFVAIEQEGGAYDPLGVKTPGAADLGQGWESTAKADSEELSPNNAAKADAARAAGRACGDAARTRGIGLLLAPVLDVLTSEVEGTDIAPRLFGKNLEAVATLGLAFADGAMDAGVVPVAKYYPGLGEKTRVGSDEVMVMRGGREEVAGKMFPFSEAATQGIPGLLAGHVAVTLFEGKDAKRSAALSPNAVRRVVREYWKYDGVILADDVALNPMTKDYPAERAAVETLQAGCDAVFFLDPDPARVRAVNVAIDEAIKNNSLPRPQLMDSNRRFNSWHARLSVPRPQPPAPPPAPAETAPPTTTDQAAETPSEPPPPAETPSPPVEEAKPATETAQPPSEETKPAVEPAQPPSEEVKPATETAPAPPTKPEEPPKPVEDKPAEPPAPEAKMEQPPNTEKVTHEIVRGDTLSRIATRYGVKADDIRTWNGMPDSTVKLGVKLTIYRPLSKDHAPAAEPPAPQTPAPAVPDPGAADPGAAPATTEQEPSVPEPEPTEPASVPADAPAQDAPPAASPEPVSEPAPEPAPEKEPGKKPTQPAEESKPAGDTGTYEVAPGDTLRNIAGRYGITTKQLMQMNKLKDADKVVVGQKLVVPKLPG